MCVCWQILYFEKGALTKYGRTYICDKNNRIIMLVLERLLFNIEFKYIKLIEI